MFKTLDKDRPFIENKYHNTGKPFDAYNRMKYHGWPRNESTGLSDGEILKKLEILEKDTKTLPHAVSKALAVKCVLDNASVDINEHDYFVYFYNWGRLTENSFYGAWREQTFDRMPDVKQLRDDAYDSGAMFIGPDFDHVVPDWDYLLANGLSGVRSNARAIREEHEKNGTLTPSAKALFEGIDIVYGATIDLVGRYCELAKNACFDKAPVIAESLERIRDGAPLTTLDALQLMYIYFIVTECVDNYQTRSLGNGIDRTLYPFYKADIESGRFTEDEIGELLGYFFMQFSAIGNYWGHPMYMGGTNLDGSTRYNEFSKLILDVYDGLDIYNPKIQIKVNLNTPRAVLDKTLDMVRRGKNSIVFSCEPGMVKAIMNYGVSYEEAYDFDISGCYETRVRANEVSTATSHVNAVKALRYVFTDGMDETVHKRIGLSTGDVAEFTSFSDVYTAFLKQWMYLIDTTMDTCDKFETYLSEINPSLMYTATIPGAMKKGRDAYQDGVKFNNTAVHSDGFATAVDGLCAVKELVFDKKLTTLAELRDAIENNWEGYEELRQRALHCKLKYGNGIAEVDRMASALSRQFCFRVNGRSNVRGGKYKAILHTAMFFVWYGEKTGATVDGRLAGEEISKNGSPTVGMDRNGATALMKSMLAIEPSMYSESSCLDLMLHPTSVSGDDGLDVMYSLLMMFAKNNGMSMQFNIFNSEMLKDAQKHPEKYRYLQVRVCGWNVLWNNIPKAQQDAYIRRAESVTE